MSLIFKYNYWSHSIKISEDKRFKLQTYKRLPYTFQQCLKTKLDYQCKNRNLDKVKLFSNLYFIQSLSNHLILKAVLNHESKTNLCMNKISP